MLTLENCDLEPVRFIDSIQSFGALIAVDTNQRVQAYSKNALEFLGIEELSLGKELHISEQILNPLCVTRTHVEDLEV